MPQLPQIGPPPSIAAAKCPTEAGTQSGSQAGVSGSRGASKSVIRLQVMTLAWMMVECGVALVSAQRARSPVLLAFGSDSLVELLSATAVLLQFLPVFPLSRAHAARAAGVLLFVLAGVVVVTALLALLFGAQPETSVSGIVITLAALVAMPVLARKKRSLARQTHNPALAADAVQSATCAYLAGIALLGLCANAVFHLRWVDSVAALAAVPILIVEGRRALRGEGCGCC
jgi:hypothetical protein